MDVPIDVDAEGDQDLDGHSPTELAEDDELGSPPGGVLLTAEEVKAETERGGLKKKKRERQMNTEPKQEAVTKIASPKDLFMEVTHLCRVGSYVTSYKFICLRCVLRGEKNERELIAWKPDK